jgi:DNA polymerase/3'-5' exonuclease PolX
MLQLPKQAQNPGQSAKAAAKVLQNNWRLWKKIRPVAGTAANQIKFILEQYLPASPQYPIYLPPMKISEMNAGRLSIAGQMRPNLIPEFRKAQMFIWIR